MFWDDLEISVAAGRGGDGAISFRTEKGTPKGGPDGGDGGRGGSVLVTATTRVNTLAEYARKREWQAPSGTRGSQAKRHGKSAPDLELLVPVGTLVSELTEDGGRRLLADLAEPEASTVVARGGIGGFGNAHFTSSVRQVPRQAELGEPGEAKRLRLELKLVAEIGIVGVPSVGKSTLLSSVTAATPKVADYPFTTTVPQLGIATVDDRRVTLADIPGLIEGAHEGKGLGDAFLRHIERTKSIIHLVDITADNPAETYRAVRAELEAFSPVLAAKPEVVALNKAEVLGPELAADVAGELEPVVGQPIRLVSAATGEGVTELLRTALAVADTYQPPEPDEPPLPVLGLADLAPEAISVTVEEDGFRVRGARIERLAVQTDFDNREAAKRFWWTVDRLGIGKQLEKSGAKADSPILIGNMTVPWPG